MARTFTRLSAVAALTVLVAAGAWAQAAGKWTWTTNFNNNEVKQTLELKVEGEKLTGSVSRGDQKTEIKDGTIKGNELSFSVTRDRQGQQVKTVYKGKVEGDTIKGTRSTNAGGQERNVEWIATRVK